MRPLLKQMMFSLITGACFGIAAWGAFTLAFISKKESLMGDWETTKYPKGVIVIDHGLEPNAQQLTIKGRIQNTTEFKWDSIELNAEFSVGEALINRCIGRTMEVRPSEISEFQIKCDDATGFNPPENLSYEIVVKYASKYSGT